MSSFNFIKIRSPLIEISNIVFFQYECKMDMQGKELCRFVVHLLMDKYYHFQLNIKSSFFYKLRKVEN